MLDNLMEAPSIRPGFTWSPASDTPAVDGSPSSTPCLDEAVILSDGQGGDALAALFSGCGPRGQEAACLAAQLLPCHALEPEQLTPDGLVKAFHACHDALLAAAQGPGPAEGSQEATPASSSSSCQHSGASALVLLHCGRRKALLVGSAGACRAALGRCSPSLGDIEALELVPDLTLGAACLETARLESTVAKPTAAACHPLTAAAAAGSGGAADDAAAAAAAANLAPDTTPASAQPAAATAPAVAAGVVRVDPVGANSEQLPPSSSADSCTSFTSSQVGAAAGRRQYMLTVDGAAVPNVPASRLLGHTAAAAAGVIATPLVAEWQVTERDAFVVLGSPALWSALSMQQVVEYVTVLLRSGMHTAPGAAAAADAAAPAGGGGDRGPRGAGSAAGAGGGCNKPEVGRMLGCSDVLTLEAQELLKLAAADASKDATAIPGVAAAVLLLPGWEQVLAQPTTAATAQLQLQRMDTAAELRAAAVQLPAGGRSNSKAAAMQLLWAVGGQGVTRPVTTAPEAALPCLLPLLVHCPWPLHLFPRERVHPPLLLARPSPSSCSDSSWSGLCLAIGTPRQEVNSLKRSASGQPLRASLNRRLSQDLELSSSARALRGPELLLASDASLSRSSCEAAGEEVEEEQLVVVHRVRLDGSGELETVLYDTATAAGPCTVVARHSNLLRCSSCGVAGEVAAAAGEAGYCYLPSREAVQAAMRSAVQPPLSYSSKGTAHPIPYHNTVTSVSAHGPYRHQARSCTANTLQYKLRSTGSTSNLVNKARSWAALTALQAASSLEAQQLATSSSREVLSCTVSHPQQGLLRSNSCSLSDINCTTGVCCSALSGSAGTASMAAAVGGGAGLGLPRQAPLTFKSAFAETAAAAGGSSTAGVLLGSRALLERQAVGVEGAHKRARSEQQQLTRLEQLAGMADHTDTEGPDQHHHQQQQLEAEAGECCYRGGLPCGSQGSSPGSRCSLASAVSLALSSSRGSLVEEAACKGRLTTYTPPADDAMPSSSTGGAMEPSPFLLQQLAVHPANAGTSSSLAAGVQVTEAVQCPAPDADGCHSAPLPLSAASKHGSSSSSSLQMLTLAADVAAGQLAVPAAAGCGERGMHGGRHKGSGLRRPASYSGTDGTSLAAQHMAAGWGALRSSRGTSSSGCPQPVPRSSYLAAPAAAAGGGAAWQSAPCTTSLLGSLGRHPGALGDASCRRAPLGWTRTAAASAFAVEGAQQEQGVGVVESEGRVRNGRHRRVTRAASALGPCSSSWLDNTMPRAQSLLVLGSPSDDTLEHCVHGGLQRGSSFASLERGSSFSGMDPGAQLQGGSSFSGPCPQGGSCWSGDSPRILSSFQASSSTNWPSSEQLYCDAGSSSPTTAAAAEPRHGSARRQQQQVAAADGAWPHSTTTSSSCYGDLAVAGAVSPRSLAVAAAAVVAATTAGVHSPTAAAGSPRQYKRTASVEKLMTSSGAINLVRMDSSFSCPGAPVSSSSCSSSSSSRGPAEQLSAGGLNCTSPTALQSLGVGDCLSPSDSCVLVGSLSETGYVPAATTSSGGSSCSSSFGSHWPGLSRMGLHGGHYVHHHPPIARTSSLGASHGFTLLPVLQEAPEGLPGTPGLQPAAGGGANGANPASPRSCSSLLMEASPPAPAAPAGPTAAAAAVASLFQERSGHTWSESEPSHGSLSMQGLMRDGDASSSCRTGSRRPSDDTQHLLSAAHSFRWSESDCSMSESPTRCGQTAEAVRRPPSAAAVHDEVSHRDHSFEFARVQCPVGLLGGVSR